MPSDHVAEARLEELLQDDSDTMTAWEVAFIESLNSHGRDLSDEQTAVLERIWKKVFA